MVKKKYTIGVDVGGTKMDAVLFNGQKVIAEFTLATPKDNLNHFLIMLDALLEPLQDKAREDKMKISGIGIGLPGVFNLSKDKIYNAPNVRILEGVKLKGEIEQKLGLPVILDNDTNCFTRAEALVGAAQKYKNVYGIIVGTGIGGGWWINNGIYDGAHGGAGEPGRFIINVDKKQEIEQLYHEIMEKDMEKFAGRAYRGDRIAEEKFEIFGRALGYLFANIVNLIDPEVIVVGGGGSQASDLFLPAAKKAMDGYIASNEAKKIKILNSKLGLQAGAIGAALLVE